MKSLLLYVLIMACYFTSPAQSAPELIAKVQQAQALLKTVSYSLQRSDTFVTGDTRKTSGEVKISIDKKDSLLGFLFRAKRDDINSETIYDGRSSFEVNHAAKKYSILNKPSNIYYFLGNPGGQMVLTDLVKIDTSKALGFSVKQDEQYYYLTMLLPDLTEYDVIKRYKIFTISKKLLLPVGMRSHQETLGKVQDLNYSITAIQVNNDATAYNFSAERFPADYLPETVQVNKKLLALKDNVAPGFLLTSFDGKPVDTNAFAGKPVLLDFWEVWCGPCIASMPKVQALYDKYKSSGLQVYGIMNEKEQLETAKLMVSKRKISFPMLTGNEAVKESYSVNAIPLYVLIGKNGKISFISEGFSNDLESEIKKSL